MSELARSQGLRRNIIAQVLLLIAVLTLALSILPWMGLTLAPRVLVVYQKMHVPLAPITVAVQSLVKLGWVAYVAFPLAVVMAAGLLLRHPQWRLFALANASLLLGFFALITAIGLLWPFFDWNNQLS